MGRYHHEVWNCLVTQEWRRSTCYGRLCSPLPQIALRMEWLNCFTDLRIIRFLTADNLHHVACQESLFIMIPNTSNSVLRCLGDHWKFAIWREDIFQFWMLKNWWPFVVKCVTPWNFIGLSNTTAEYLHISCNHFRKLKYESRILCKNGRPSNGFVKNRFAKTIDPHTNLLVGVNL